MKHKGVIWKDRKRNFLGLPWTFTVYTMAEDRLFVDTGLLTSREDEVRLYRITDLSLTRSLWQRIIGCGTVIIYVRDTDTPQKEVRCIKHPREFLKMLDQQINHERDRYNTRGRDLYGIGKPPHMYHEMHDDTEACDCDYSDQDHY